MTNLVIEDLELSSYKRIKPLIFDLMIQCIIEEYGKPPDLASIDTLIEHYYAREDSKIFFLKENKTFCGFVWLIDSSDAVSSESFSLIFYLALKEEFRGKGYGKLLINHAKEYCKSRNLKELKLSVRADNTKAINLYRKFGFETYKLEMSVKL